jgi:hypothetical protein
MLCLIAVISIYGAQIGSDPAQRALDICREVEHRAKARELDPMIAVAIAAEESRFTRPISSAGAVGPLQVLPHYWCPKKGNCNEIEAGLDAMAYYLKRARGVESKAFMWYAGGDGPRSRAYAQRVSKRLNYLRKSMSRRSKPTSH